MKKIFFQILFFVAALNVSAQKYLLEKGVIIFFSDATIEDIKAENGKANSMFNTQTSDVAFSVPIREFQFDKKLMQQHFNEKYMESEKYPKATFSGKMEGFDPAIKSVRQVKARGKLTIHGVATEVEIPGTIEVVGDKIMMKSKFMVKLEDYKIKIPQLMWQNIAEQVEVTVEFSYKPQ